MTSGFESLIQNLESDDGKVRREAILALSYDGEKAVPALLKAVREDDVSMEAVSEVFKQIGGEAIDPLTDMLHSDNNDYQRKAAYILATTGDSRALVQLIITLDDEDPLVRAEVASALGNFRDSRAMGPLLKAMQDKEASVRASAALSLGNFQDSKITDALLMGLEDREALVRRSAIRALAYHPEEYVKPALTLATHDPDEGARQMAAAALQHLKGDSVAFERLNLEGDISEELKQSIDKILEDGKIDTQDIGILRHSNPRVRSELLMYVAEMSGPEMVRLLLPGLNDINPAVRSKAVKSLTNLGKKGVDKLLELLPEQTSSFTRAGIANVLGNIGDDRALVPLMQMLQDEHERVVISATDALATLNNDDAIDPLLQLLKHDSEAVQEHATRALQKLGYDPRSEGTAMRKLFRRLFGDKD